MATPAEQGQSKPLNGLAGKVPSQPVIANQGLTSRGSNSKSRDDPETKNAARQCDARGVPSVQEIGADRIPCILDTPKSGSRASLKGFKDRHIRAARMLVYALTLSDVSSWLRAVRVWTVRLTVGERQALATAALGALPEDEAHEIAEAYLRPFCGPLPPFLNTMDEARHWADWASEVERKAAMAACWQLMPAADRAAFLEWAQGRAAA